MHSFIRRRAGGKKAHRLFNKEIILISDIHECSKDNDCHSDANCINRTGSYACQCRDGFTGDGKHCPGTQNQKKI